MRRTQSGFTLLELLVAITIFAVMSVLAYGGLKTVLDNRTLTDAQAQRLAAIQTAFTRLERDIEQLTARGIRDEFGDPQPALLATSGSGARMEFTHAGWNNPAYTARSRLQRVAWSVEDEKLLRAWWPVLDRAPGVQPVQGVMLAQVTAVEWRFMAADGEWHDQWPPQTAAGKPAGVLPHAVEISLELADLGHITRLFRVPGGAALNPPQQGQTP